MAELEGGGPPFAVDRSVDENSNPMLELRGELDMSSADGLRDTVDEIVGSKPQKMVFDLAGLSFMDSSGIAVLVYAANRVGTIELRHVQPIIRRIVEASGLSGILRLDEP